MARILLLKDQPSLDLNRVRRFHSYTEEPMKRTTARLLSNAIAALLLAAPLATHAAIATFDDVANTTGVPFSSGGLDFSGGYTYVWNGPGYGADNGTLSLISGSSGSFTITRTGGGTFTLDQLDAGLSWYTGQTAYDITVGPDVITLTPAYQTYTFSDLVNVSSVTVEFAPGDGYLSVDNIVWHDGSNVPEPASLMLFGAALLGLAATRKQKQA